MFRNWLLTILFFSWYSLFAFDNGKNPRIVGQQSVSTTEDQPVTLTVNDVIVVFDAQDDQEGPDVLTLQVYEGTNYTVSGNTITPVANFNGTLSIPVTVSDGETTSGSYNLQMQVSADNDAPTITGQTSLSTNEEQAIDITFSHLTVNDPDNTYPNGFTMEISGGTGYSVSGSTITPDSEFSGTLSVPVTVNDGISNSNTYYVQIQVNAINDPPVITGQTNLTTNENQAFDLSLSYLSVTDPDNTYPDNFTLVIAAGDNYTASGNTITPASGFNGVLSIPVTVSDGSSNSNTFYFQATVNPVNDPPAITGQVALQTNEEQPVAISLSDLIVSDPDNVYPNGFSLSLYPGDNYTASGNIITPAVNFSGILTVPVTVNDGTTNSEPFNIQINVIAQNDAPTITGQVPLATNEDQALTLELSQLIVTDVDNIYPNGFTMTVEAGGNYTVQGATVTPAANFSGNLTVPVTVNDGMASSPVFNVVIQVNNVNDPPVITGQQPAQVNEDTPIALSLSLIQVTDSDNVYPNGFTLAVTPGSNYTVSGTTITPASNFTGVLSVPIIVNDGLNNSQPFNFQIQVIGVNDPPVITSQTSLQTNEDQSLELKLSNFTVSDPDNTYPTGFTLAIGQSANYAVSGNTITPAANFTGTLTVPVTVNDGANNSNTFNAQVAVVPVNDAPVITGQSTLNIYKNKTLKVELSHLKATDPDNSYPQGFSLTVLPGINYTALDNVVTPSYDFVGTLQVNVVVNDGNANSNTYPLIVNVVPPPNVVPVIIGQVKLSTYENQPLTLALTHLVVTDPDNIFPGDFKLNILSGSVHAQYTINGNVITPAKDFSGTLTVTVTVSDKESTSEPYDISIEVLPVADVPLITSQLFLHMNEDDSLVLKFTDLIVIDPDDTYPTGFTMTVSTGSNYTVEGLKIKPTKNYNGYLSVPVTVNDGVNNSAPYNVLIFVEPQNDAPVLSSDQEEPLVHTSGKGALKIFETLTISDVDDDSLTLAEISFDPALYELNNDTLIYHSLPSIRAVFDRSSGILVLIGKASIADYQSLVRDIQFDYKGQSSTATKILRIMVSDGKVNSQILEQRINLGGENIVLDIPSGFTPNGDGANDTWSIKPAQGNDGFAQAMVRIYNKRGALVFESTGLDKEWDGRMEGALLPADTYFYTIDLNGSYAKRRYQGVVVILR